MSYFWACVLHGFLPATLLLASHWSWRHPASSRFYVLGSIALLLTGMFAGLLLPRTTPFALAFYSTQATLIVFFLLWQWNRRHGSFWHLLIVIMATLQWAISGTVLHELTNTQVINTELILNLASLCTAFALCMILCWLLCACLRLMPGWRWPLIVIAAALWLVPISGEIALTLMKLNIVDSSKGLISYVAKTTRPSSEISYIALAVALLLPLSAVLSVLRKHKHHFTQQKSLIAKRQALAQYRQTRNLQLGLVIVVLSLSSVQIFWDAVASQPPRLSPATRVEASNDDAVHLPLDPLMDGNLHRFSWVSGDGKVVRFFVINRLEDKVSPAVVFDACMLCGDRGYAQRGNQVVCISCGVYLFKPTIGKPGGCNPILIPDWRTEGPDIIIPTASLETGLLYSSEIVTIAVTDPVSGKALTNKDAPYHYSHGGKTYFFADESSRDAFVEEPERFIKGSIQ